MGEEQFDASPFGSVPRVTLTRPTWDDIVIPASLINPVGSPSPPTIDNTDGTLRFGAGVTNTVAFLCQLPHGWREGTNIVFHIHWCKTTSAVGTVGWEAQFAWCNAAEVFPGFGGLTGPVVIYPNADIANMHAIAAWADLSGAGKFISSMIKVWLQRTAGDTYAADAKLLSADFHIQIDTLGSPDHQWVKSP